MFSKGAWRAEPDDDAFLAIDSHDSDIATVDFQSVSTAGRFYLGFQPHDFWGHPGASDPVHAHAEAAGLGAWAKEILNRSVAPKAILPLLAEDGVEDPRHDFVEEGAACLIERLGLPLPNDLPPPP